MQTVALMYHDVVEEGMHAASGFPEPDASLYKLEVQQFDAHLNAIAWALGTMPSHEAGSSEAAGKRRKVLLTFDDGGLSAYTHIAKALEERGWRGHFFITAGQIGRRGFLNREQIQELHRRGHVIGAHSFSHPLRMARCRWEEVVMEWRESVEILSAIVGESIRVASVPGGDYSRGIAAAASFAGIEVLFTSEPTLRCWRVDRCEVHGRYTIQRWTQPESAAGLVAGRWVPRLRQQLWWRTKGVAKVLGGEYYLKLRNAFAGLE